MASATPGALRGFVSRLFVSLTGQLRGPRRSTLRRVHNALSAVVVVAMLVGMFNWGGIGAGGTANASTKNGLQGSSQGPEPRNVPKPPAPIESPTGESTSTATITPVEMTPTVTVGATESATATGSATSTIIVPTPSGAASGTATNTSTGTPTGSATATGTPGTPTESVTPSGPPPTYTVVLPTAPPALTPIPDTNIVDQEIARERQELLDAVAALPHVTLTTGMRTVGMRIPISGAEIDPTTGASVTSADGGLTVGIMPNAVTMSQNDLLDVQITRKYFPPEAPGGTRDGQPLAYTYELTTTSKLTGQGIKNFSKDVTLIWNLDRAALEAAGVTGYPYHVYTFNEDGGYWEELLSTYDEATGQLIAQTNHFSLYSVGDGFSKVANYVPKVNNFETNLQSGTASVNYPIEVPAGPGGLAPSVSISYNSGNVDRVDVTQQGTSPIGWGWSLSMSYVAASQHSFVPTPPGGGGTPTSTPSITHTPTWPLYLTLTPNPSLTPNPEPADGGYYPWTASIVSDGANGDLVRGQDGYWHTAGESYARIQYFPGSGQGYDWWEAWSKDGTHYVFNLRTLTLDEHARGLVTNRWMLSSVTDVYGNRINYSYKYEPSIGLTATPTLTGTPITNGITKAVYPYQISWGATDGSTDGSGDKLRVEFNITGRAIGADNDISYKDRDSGLYQSYRINQIDVKRKQDGSGFALLRRYSLTQDYSTRLTVPVRTAIPDPPTPTPTPTPTPISTPPSFPHLTLNGITPYGNDEITRLPSTTFVYFQSTTDPAYPLQDWGHLWWANNGYGGAVGFYYDAVGSDAPSAYRRVRAKRVQDGLAPYAPPHDMTYRYFGRGAAVNDPQHSGAAGTQKPLHEPGTQFRGFAWVQEQSPIQQNASPPVYQSVEHYYSQDDIFNAREWRVESGKHVTFTYEMETPFPLATPIPSTTAVWTTSGSLSRVTDPTPPGSGNGVWRLLQGASISRNAGVSDGSEVSVRFMLRDGGGVDPHSTQYLGTFKLENMSNSDEYWGVKIYTRWNGQNPGAYELNPKVVWKVGGTEGERDLSNVSVHSPRNRGPMPANRWFRLRLHTSPDGRFAVEIHEDSPSKSYLQVKSGDPATSGGSNGLIPTFNTGMTWKFKHSVETSTNNSYSSLVDNYSETRTVFSQSDTWYTATTITTATRNNTPWVGNNNVDGMSIRFVPVSESRGATYGSWASEPGQTKRTRTEYGYDGFGNHISVKEHGDLDPGITGDDRSTHSEYAVATATASPSGAVTQYIVDRIRWTNTYKTITGNSGGTNMMGQVLYYYDCNLTTNNCGTANYGEIGGLPEGKGRLNRVKQVGIIAGNAADGESYQDIHYDTWGNQDWVKDPLGHQTTTAYDTYYRSFVTSVTYPNNTSTSNTAFDFTVDRVTQAQDPNGLVTETRYDKFGRPTKSWVASNGGTTYDSETYPTESYTFQDTNQASVQPPFYISLERRVKSHTASEDATTWATRWFDGRGRTLEDVSVKAAMGPTPSTCDTCIVTYYTYTDTGQIESVSLPYEVTMSVTSSRYTYIQPNPAMPKMTKYYDGLGRATLDVNPDGTRVTYDYNYLWSVGVGEETGLRGEGWHWKSWTHTDAMGRIDQARELDQDQTHGWWQDVSTYYEYDALNHLTKVKRAADTPDETISTMTYDGLGRKKQMTDPDMGTWQYGYDAAGNLLMQKDPLFLTQNRADHLIYFDYDSMNRPIAKYYGQEHANSDLADVRYYYDNDLGDASSAHSWGKLRQANVIGYGADAAKSNGHAYYYDGRGRLTSDVVTTTSAYTSRPYTTTYAYDTGDRLTSLVYPNYSDPQSNPTITPETVTIDYNKQGMGLPIKLTSNVAGNPYPAENALYNARGQLTELGQGTASSNLNYLTTRFRYDDATTKRGWLAHIKVMSAIGPNTNTHLDMYMDYSANGNVNRVRQVAADGSGGSTASPVFTNTFTYDGLDRLRIASSITSDNTRLFPREQYEFDDLGRMTERQIDGSPILNYTYPDAGAPGPKDGPTSYRGNTYTYDADGNQITRSTGGTTETRTYDPENRLTTIVTGTTTLEYVYDANGQRIIKTVLDGPAGTPTPTDTPTTAPTNTPTFTPTAVPSPYHYLVLQSNEGSRPVTLPGRNAGHTGDIGEEGDPIDPGTVINVGDKFTLDMMIGAGEQEVRAQQAYLVFPSDLLANVNATQSGCVLTNTVTADTSYFDSYIQNEVCNGPGECTFAGKTVAPGSMAYVSGLSSTTPTPNCPSPGGCSGTFRVAQLAFCAKAPGTAYIRWQFKATHDPETRDTQILDAGNNNVNDYHAYQQFMITIVGDPWTPTPTNTHTNTPIYSPTPTNTFTNTRTPTPTRTFTDTPTAEATAILVGHVAWEGAGTVPSYRSMKPITLTLKSATTEINYPRQDTDVYGFFTVPVVGLANGTYSWRVKGPDGVGKTLATDPPGYLANSGTVTLSGAAQTNVEMGTMGAGDCNNDNLVSASDFTTLKNTFGKSEGQVGYDTRAEYTSDHVVNAADFMLLRGHFGQAGAGVLTPDGPEGMEESDSRVPVPPVGASGAQRRPLPNAANTSSRDQGNQDKQGSPDRVWTVSSRTLYIGGLYEEDITNGSTSTSPYIVYYTLGGKLVGMRRANQVSGNGQYRIVGDHLGSTTLILDTPTNNTTPTVVQRQYSKPYGETAWQAASGGGLTSIGYTGQRQEGEVGLMFYGARFYDPVLSHFISADTIAPDRGNPKSRNRYGYALSNPMRYTDPSGHSAEPSDLDSGLRDLMSEIASVHASGKRGDTTYGLSNYEKCKGGDRAACKAEFALFGFDINTVEWELSELLLMLEAINDLLKASHHAVGDHAAFRNIMGIGPKDALVRLRNIDKTKDKVPDGCGIACEVSDGSAMFLSPTGLEDFHNKNQNTNTNTTWPQAFKYAFVHEMGHLMDDRNDLKYSKGLYGATFTGYGLCMGWGRVCIFPKHEGSVSNTGNCSGCDRLSEDWAEMVATKVYPGWRPDTEHGDWYSAPKHKAYVDSVFK